LIFSSPNQSNNNDDLWILYRDAIVLLYVNYYDLSTIIWFHCSILYTNLDLDYKFCLNWLFINLCFQNRLNLDNWYGIEY